MTCYYDIMVYFFFVAYCVFLLLHLFLYSFFLVFFLFFFNLRVFFVVFLFVFVRHHAEVQEDHSDLPSLQERHHQAPPRLFPSFPCISYLVFSVFSRFSLLFMTTDRMEEAARYRQPDASPLQGHGPDAAHWLRD